MKKIKMSHNEYREFLKVNANRIYTEEGYSYNQYCLDADNVEIIPFDLSDFNLPQDIQKSINDIFKEETTDKNGAYMLTGFSYSEEDWCKITDKLNLTRVMECYYSGYAYSEQFNMYMIYAEGDLYLKLFKSKEEYKKALQETIKWYEENQ